MKIITSAILITVYVVQTGFTQQNPPVTAKEIFVKQCSRCHGKDGTKGLFGAKDLQKSKLTSIEYFNIIANGKSIMPTWRHRLTAEQIKQVIDYIKEFRK